MFEFTASFSSISSLLTMSHPSFSEALHTIKDNFLQVNSVFALLFYASALMAPFFGLCFKTFLNLFR